MLPTRLNFFSFLVAALAVAVYFYRDQLLSTFQRLSHMQQREILPGNVVPSHYVLNLWPNLDTFHYKGTVSVELRVVENTKSVVLNTKELEVQKAHIAVRTGKTEQTLEASDIQMDEKLERCTMTFPSELPAGATATLTVHFTGTHNDKMCGFYRSGYTAADGSQKYMLVTQFEATDARRAFPCWDEPSLKATFDVTMHVPKHLTALSNMNVEDTKEDADVKAVHFATTPIMSTYLVAFAVGDFEYVEASTSGEHNGSAVLCRVYTLPGASNQGRFALDVCTKTLEFFAGVFGTPYPLPKMDMLAVPDFDAGAMENWGLVTYRTVALLWDEKTSNAKSKEGVAYTVAHELAHQWFGNLVTMQWWSELWLNEGFATWVGWLAVDHLFPEWEVWTQFVADEFQRGLGLDSLRSSHPIEVDIMSASQISQIFDAISYSKGASVIRMLSSYLGQDTFLAGIRRYLARHKYSNASTLDLWKALSEESGRDVGEFMQLWTRHVGHPVVTVSAKDGDKIVVRQNRFLATGDANSEEDSTLWWIPLSMSNENGLTGTGEVLTEREAEFTKASGQFFKLNGLHTGLYRTKYDDSQFAQLIEAIRKGQLSTTDRVGILSDTSVLATSGIGSTRALLELFEAYENEEEYIVWMDLAERLESMRLAWFEEPQHVQDALKALQRKLFSKQAHALGWDYPENEAYGKTMLRSLALGRAGLAGDEQVIQEARNRFARFIQGDHSAIHPNVRANVFRIVIAHGGEQEWEAVRKIYLETDTADQKLGALGALSCAPSADLINRALDYSMHPDVRPQDIIYVHRSLVLNPKAPHLMFKFLQARWDELEKRYSGSLGLLGAVIKCCGGGFAKESDRDQVAAFFNGKDTTMYDRPLQQTLEKITVTAQRVARARDEVRAWAEARH